MADQKIVCISYIVTTPERVWTALTEGAITRCYFFGRRVESDFQVGSRLVYWQEDHTLDVSGRVLECQPCRLLSCTWRVEWIDELRQLPEAIVTFRIDPLGDIVRLTVTESHPEPIDEKYLEGGRRGWPVILSSLKSLLETGKPLPDFDWTS